MAINFSDPTCGFYHREVVGFLNEQIVKNGSNRCFSRIHLCKSWSAVERELLTIVTDSAMPRSLKKSCAWSALALGRSLAEKQAQEYREKVKIMQDQIDEQRLFINALLGMVQKQRDKHQDEKGVGEFGLQQGLPPDLNRVEGEQSFLTSTPFTLVRNQFQSQEGRRDEAQGTGPDPSGSVVPHGDGGYDWTVSGQSASAAAAAATVPLDEGNGFSERANRNEESYSEIQRAWSQTNPLASLSLASTSAQPRFVSQEAGTEVQQICAVPSLTSSRASWRDKQFHRRKMLSYKFRARADSSQYRNYSVIRRAGDWYCDECNVMNFSWRNVCFRCKQFQETRVIEDFLHNWRYM
ncbi:testis-expressed protein 13A-like [Apodemus sylvaticus]|uniref:testis-expressed protein 13A-like n=1 Tax=Apodemus sylvaticus TaxID=10129 RepID=UPI0022448675|nr:testis-expressed protein 13A-like [Apodemus sylvaticus]